MEPLRKARAVKLYVWNNPYDVNYGGSCLYVVAESEDQARALAPAALVAKYGNPWDKNRHLGAVKLGAPDRVHELPHAEVYEWSE